jgi:hypothetical protein
VKTSYLTIRELLSPDQTMESHAKGLKQSSIPSLKASHGKEHNGPQPGHFCLLAPVIIEDEMAWDSLLSLSAHPLFSDQP